MDGPAYIQRALLVVEFSTPVDGATQAFVVTQSGGTLRYTIEADDDFGYYDGQYGYRPHGRPTRTSVQMDGHGKATWYRNADDLFRQWRGEQPTRPAEIEPHRPALDPHRPELGP